MAGLVYGIKDNICQVKQKIVESSFMLQNVQARAKRHCRYRQPRYTKARNPSWRQIMAARERRLISDSEATGLAVCRSSRSGA